MALPALAVAVAAVYVGKKILDKFTKPPIIIGHPGPGVGKMILDKFTKPPISDPGPGGPAGPLPRTAFDFFSNQETKPDTPSSRDPNNND